MEYRKKINKPLGKNRKSIIQNAIEKIRRSIIEKMLLNLTGGDFQYISFSG